MKSKEKSRELRKCLKISAIKSLIKRKICIFRAFTRDARRDVRKTALYSILY